MADELTVALCLLFSALECKYAAAGRRSSCTGRCDEDDLLGSGEDEEPFVQGLRGCSLRWRLLAFDHARHIPGVLTPTAPCLPLHPARLPLCRPHRTSP